MKAELLNLKKEKVGDVTIDDSIFGLEVRPDLIKRVVDWQRAKSMSGTHKVKTTSEVSGTTKKPFKQKGTGNARQGTLRAVQMRGGGVAHGPSVRSHATKLQKKVKKLGLRHALSLKSELGQLFIIDSTNTKDVSTKNLVSNLDKFGAGKVFVIDGAAVGKNFSLSSQGAKGVKVVPTIGANVYDLVNSDVVIIAQEALPLLAERLK